jgi:hypothetical protein
MDKQKPRLIGSDGELVVPVRVEKPKRQPGDGRRLTNRVGLMVVVLIVLFGGLVVGVIGLQNLQTGMIAQKPTLAVIPSRFANGPYQVTMNLNLNMKNLDDLPCANRRIQVEVEGKTPVKMRLEAALDHGTYHSETTLANAATFDIPAAEGDLFHLWLYDAQDTMVGALQSIQFGTNDFHFCTLPVTFSPVGGQR